jgi:hypothetical protein
MFVGSDGGFLLLCVAGILLLYVVVRLAVKHAILDAHRERDEADAAAVRRQLGIGPERSPNSRP